MQILKSVPLKLLRCNLKGNVLTILIRFQQLCYTFLWHYKISIKNSSTQQSTNESLEFRAALQETKRQKRQNVKYPTLKLCGFLPDKWKMSSVASIKVLLWLWVSLEVFTDMSLCHHLIVIRWTWSRWEETPVWGRILNIVASLQDF